MHKNIKFDTPLISWYQMIKDLVPFISAKWKKNQSSKFNNFWPSKIAFLFTQWKLPMSEVTTSNTIATLHETVIVIIYKILTQFIWFPENRGFSRPAESTMKHNVPIWTSVSYPNSYRISFIYVNISQIRCCWSWSRQSLNAQFQTHWGFK